MMDSMGFNDCLLFIQEFGTDCFCLVINIFCSLALFPIHLVIISSQNTLVRATNNSPIYGVSTVRPNPYTRLEYSLTNICLFVYAQMTRYIAAMPLFEMRWRRRKTGWLLLA